MFNGSFEDVSNCLYKMYRTSKAIVHGKIEKEIIY